MTKFEEEFNYLIELSWKVLIGQIDAKAFEKNRIAFFEKYETDKQRALPVVPECVGKLINTFGAPEDGKYINYAASYLENQKELDWIDNHQKTWLTALLNGFTVEKNIVYPCPVCGYENVKSNFCSICGRKNDYE